MSCKSSIWRGPEWRGSDDLIGVGILDLQQVHFDSTKFLIGGVTRGGIKWAEAKIYNYIVHTFNYECFRFKTDSYSREMNFADELTDIPYTPMQDRSIDEGAATSSARDPPDPIRSGPRPLLRGRQRADKLSQL